MDIGVTTLGNELLWRKGAANSDSYFTITNLLSSKILTAVSFNFTIGKEAENPNIIGLEIHGKILYSCFLLRNLLLCPFTVPNCFEKVQNILDMCQKALMNTVCTPL